MLCSVKIYFHYDSRPTDDWTLNLEYDGITSLEGLTVDDQTADLVAALQPFLLDNVIIDRAAWATWVPDSEPYDPDALRTIPIGVAGLRTFGLTTPVDDDLAYLIRKETPSGRNGRAYIKGALLVANITADGGAWRLVDGVVGAFEDWVTALEAAITNSAQCVLAGVSQTSIIYPATPEGVKQIPIRTYTATPHIRPVGGLVGVAPTERQAKQ